METNNAAAVVRWRRLMVILIVYWLPHYIVGPWPQPQEQISWTPIYVDTANRLDLWTISSTGCDCPGESLLGSGGSKQCACCVKPGGCLCSFSHNKCAQCGLENACQRFCNVTLSSKTIAARSGLSWAQIKSPELDGPTSCWWRLHSAPGQRIEVQIHRIISVGHYNNNTLACSGGLLQFSDGDISIPIRQAVQMCAQNSRYSPPIVMFGDQGTATLLVRTDSTAKGSMLLAYVSFSSADDPGVGYFGKGGRRLHSSSGCDWVYDACYGQECVLTSPGFPGLFPPSRRCRYFLTANATTDKIRLRFTSVSLPPKSLCSTHHIAIWRRDVFNLQNWPGPWKKLCGKAENQNGDTEEENASSSILSGTTSPLSLEIDGPVAAIEFKSGLTVPPYIYTGFRVAVQFLSNDAKSKTKPTSISNTTTTTGPSNSRSRGRSHPHQDTQKHQHHHPRPHSHQRQGSHAVDQSSEEEEEDYDEEEDEEEDEEDEPVKSRVHSATPGFETRNVVQSITCGHIFDAGFVRGSVFRLIIPRDSVPKFRPPGLNPNNPHYHQHGGVSVDGNFFNCHLEFVGKAMDIVQLALFNYRLRGPGCSSYIRLYDITLPPPATDGGSGVYKNGSNPSGNQTEAYRALGKLCGPSGNHLKRFTSSHSRMTVVVSLFLPSPHASSSSSSSHHHHQHPPHPQDTQTSSSSSSLLAAEFLDGVFRFHDESIEGTVKPMSSCEVVYYGVTSPPSGSILGPPNSPLLRLSSFPLVCAYSFFPGASQTISLTLTKAGQETSSSALPGSKKYCRSYCGPSGCACDSKYAALKDIDHLLIVDGGSTPISCLCGYFPNALPMTFESQSSLTLVYHATQAESGNEFGYAVGFLFKRRTICANFSISPPSGHKRWREALSSSGTGSPLHVQSSYIRNQHYTSFECVWPVSIPPRYNLSIDFIAEEIEQDCNAWNLTLWPGEPTFSSNDYRNVIGSFCPRSMRQQVRVAYGLTEAYIRLTGVSLKSPQFEIRWRYTDVLLPGLADGTAIISSSDGCGACRLERLFLWVAFFIFLCHQE